MRERAELLHGRLRIFSRPACGTLVYARFPLA
jgi:signal transduction histidine kinase